MQDMLGKIGRIVQSLMTVTEENLGALVDLFDKLTGQDGSDWFARLKKFLRNESCLKLSYTRLISGEAVLTLVADKGTKTIADAGTVFRAGISNNFKAWGTNKGATAPAVNVVVHELVRDGKLSEILGGLATDPKTLCIGQGQTLEFIAKYSDWLRTDGWATLFPFKVKFDEGTKIEREEVFVARVFLHSAGRLKADVDRLSHGLVWSAGYRPRLVVPQLATPAT